MRRTVRDRPRRSPRRPSLLAGLALLALASTVEAGWHDPAWGYRKVLVVNGQPDAGDCSSGTCVAGALTDFPVLVSLASDADLAARAQEDGDDILFTDGTGSTKLDHEIESFDGGTGALVAWVRIPTLSATTDTTIYLYYGNAGASSRANPTSVWDASFRAVWHLRESGNGTAGEFKDSTSNANHGQGGGGFGGGTPARSTPDPLADGQIGPAQHFVRGETDFISVPDDGTLRIRGALTVEAWVKGDSWTNYYSAAVTKQNGTGSEDAYGLWVGLESELASYMNRLGLFGAGGQVPTGSWRHLAVTRSSDGSRILYVNGLPVATAGPFAPSVDANPVLIGANNNFGCIQELWDGLIDEVRISDSARSQEWLRSGYNNEMYQGVGPTRFIRTLGDQEVGATLASLTAAGVP